jgi:hypothetical protein
VATPTPQQARSHHGRQAAIAAAAGLAVRRLFKRWRGWGALLETVASYQLASAQASVNTIASWAGDSSPVVRPESFAGVSSFGFPVSEPIVATIDGTIPAPIAPLPDNWWAEAEKFMQDEAARVLEQIVAAEVQDAGRSAAQAEIVVRPDWQNYVRLLTPPSCKRCTVLAGRIYRDLDGFLRHPGCDCVHVPVENWEQAHDAGLVSSPREAFENGHIRDLTKAEQQAIEDGADIGKVINSSSGIYIADIGGRRAKATTYGTTRRSAWRKANPSVRVRLRPEAIYAIANGDRDEVMRLLRLHGYI